MGMLIVDSSDDDNDNSDGKYNDIECDDDNGVERQWQ